jgi:hypothetical protein
MRDDIQNEAKVLADKAKALRAEIDTLLLRAIGDHQDRTIFMLWDALAGATEAADNLDSYSCLAEG